MDTKLSLRRHFLDRYHREGPFSVFNACEGEVVSIPVEPSGRGTRRFIEKARQCWRGMSAGIVYPTPGWTCGGCGHAKLCARWPTLPALEASKDAA